MYKSRAFIVEPVNKLEKLFWNPFTRNDNEYINIICTHFRYSEIIKQQFNANFELKMAPTAFHCPRLLHI